YLLDLLQSAGFAQIKIEAFDARVSSGNLDAMMAELTKVGALGKLLRAAPALVSRVEPKVRAALVADASDRDISLNAATWIVTATAQKLNCASAGGQRPHPRQVHRRA